MEKLTEVLAMGGFAVYVWPSFILATLVLSGLTAAGLRSLRKAQRTLALLQERPE